MSFGESLAPLLGRWVMAWFFLTQAYRYGLDWNNTAILLTMKNIPTPPIILLIALVGLLLGSLSLLLGFCTRAGALALFAITIAATVTLHDYWHIRAEAARGADYDIFVRNIAIAGGLLMLIGMGSGRFGMDNVKPKASPKPGPVKPGKR
jgi:putative oxidoreductase